MRKIVRLEDLDKKIIKYVERGASLDNKKIKQNQILINNIIDKIKDSKDNGTILSLTKIKNNYNVTMADCRMLMSYIKNMDNILTNRCNEINGKIIPVNSRPEKYKWINDINSVTFADRLVDYIKDFTEEDINYLKQFKNNKNINSILYLYWYLSTHDFRNQWTKSSITELGRKTTIPMDTLFDILKLFDKDNKILFSIDKNNVYIQLSTSDKQNDEQQAEDNIQNTTNNIKTEYIEERVVEQSSKVESLVQNNNDELEKDIDRLKNNIFTFFNNQKQLINESIANQQYKFNKTGEVIDKLVTTNNELNDKLKHQNELIVELTKKKDEQDRNLIALKSYSDKLFKHTIDVLEMLMGELSNMTDEFVRIPRHQLHQNNEATRYKGKFCSAIGKRVNEIVEYSPDSNMPEKELK